MIEISLNQSQTQQLLQNLERNINNTRGAMQNIGEELVSRITENLGHGLDYRGQAFKPLSDKYQKRVPRRRGGIPLNDTRQHIYQNINYKLLGNDGLEVGQLSDQKIGAAHQYGTRKGIPRRPFMPIDEGGNVDLPQDWDSAIIEAITAHLVGF